MNRTIPSGDDAIIFVPKPPTPQAVDGLIHLTIAGQRYVMTRHIALFMMASVKRVVHEEMAEIVPFTAPKRKPRKAARS